ncbi:MAG TPA: hypothetical protein VD838_17565 [Anaeromyxobacteraceae bacterium]|nr:hypothetical protein [Anaeromyxobacteraceae bacterium]
MAVASSEAAGAEGEPGAPRARVELVAAGDGPPRSLPFDDALARLATLGAAHAEVVLGGAHLGAFGLDLEPRRSLTELLRAAVARGLGRIRLGAIEPLEFPSDVLLEPGPAHALCEHFHLAVRSGSDRILAAMGAPHRVDDCRRAVLELDALVPGACLGADLIVGYPGETDEDHAATRAFVESLPLSRIRVLPWAPERPPPAARVEELSAIAARKWRAFLAGLAGRELEVVVEQVDGGLARGVARQAATVRWPSAGDRVGAVARVRVEASDGRELFGVHAATFRSRLPP